jgi:O-antigen ligase
MKSNTHIRLEKEAGPALFWSGLLVTCAVAWSFRLTSFLHAKEAVLALGLPVAVLWQYRAGRLTRQGFRQLAPLWIGLMVWGLSGLFTARVAAYHLESLLRWTVTLTAASLALDAFRIRNGRLLLYHAFLGSGILVGVLALLQYAGVLEILFPVFPGYDQRAYSVFGNQNLLGGYMAVNLVLLLSLAVRARKKTLSRVLLFTFTFAILLGALILSSTRTAWFAALAGCMALLLSPGIFLRLFRMLWIRQARQILLPLLVAALLLGMGTPLLVERISKTFTKSDIGGRARLWFWAGGIQMARDFPLLGVGLGQYGYWSPVYQGRVLWQPGGEQYFSNELHTDHAHSEPLEWLAETGILGAFFWLWFIFRALKCPVPVLPALIALAVFGCFNTFSHSPPHILALCLLATAGPSAPCKGGKIAVIPAFLCGALLAAAFISIILVPSALLCDAEQAHVAGDTSPVRYERSLAWFWSIPRAHESYAIALMDKGQYDAALQHLELARTGVDTGRVYWLLAKASSARGDKDGALYYARECLLRWPRNEYAWSVVLERCPAKHRSEWEQARRRFLGLVE